VNRRDNITAQSWGLRPAAKLAAIPAGASPADIGVQSALNHADGRPRSSSTGSVHFDLVNIDPGEDDRAAITNTEATAALARKRQVQPLAKKITCIS
jgi:hypothetical protein